ncbi:hypothetical protein P8C59_008497 [Phyllachora maydis]|uniref:Protein DETOXIFICATION n=1 Tax=Phyllachora maydis TaxID=1825666 RepID=A0AAD9IAT8_9PEZI|nr:hypothetical protein P8C59_008497 [Phyllachora maydis]
MLLKVVAPGPACTWRFHQPISSSHKGRAMKKTMNLEYSSGEGAKEKKRRGEEDIQVRTPEFFEILKFGRVLMVAVEYDVAIRRHGDQPYQDSIVRAMRPSRAWVLAQASLPVIVAYMLQNSLQTVSVLIVGRLSAEALGTAAFSYMFAMSTAWLIGLGGTTALDTLASSSFTGSANKHELGVLLQRALLVLTAFYALVAVVWACSEGLFRALGQEEYICVQSARFLLLLIPGGLGYVWFEAMKKFLQAQGEMKHGCELLSSADEAG